MMDSLISARRNSVPSLSSTVNTDGDALSLTSSRTLNGNECDEILFSSSSSCSSMEDDEEENDSKNHIDSCRRCLDQNSSSFTGETSEKKMLRTRAGKEENGRDIYPTKWIHSSSSMTIVKTADFSVAAMTSEVADNIISLLPSSKETRKDGLLTNLSSHDQGDEDGKWWQHKTCIPLVTNQSNLEQILDKNNDQYIVQQEYQQHYMDMSLDKSEEKDTDNTMEDEDMPVISMIERFLKQLDRETTLSSIDTITAIERTTTLPTSTIEKDNTKYIIVQQREGGGENDKGRQDAEVETMMVLKDKIGGNEIPSNEMEDEEISVISMVDRFLELLDKEAALSPTGSDTSSTAATRSHTFTTVTRSHPIFCTPDNNCTKYIDEQQEEFHGDEERMQSMEGGNGGKRGGGKIPSYVSLPGFHHRSPNASPLSSFSPLSEDTLLIIAPQEQTGDFTSLSSVPLNAGEVKHIHDSGLRQRRNAVSLDCRTQDTTHQIATPQKALHIDDDSGCPRRRLTLGHPLFVCVAPQQQDDKIAGNYNQSDSNQGRPVLNLCDEVGFVAPRTDTGNYMITGGLSILKFHAWMMCIVLAILLPWADIALQGKLQ